MERGCVSDEEALLAVGETRPRMLRSISSATAAIDAEAFGARRGHVVRRWLAGLALLTLSAATAAASSKMLSGAAAGRWSPRSSFAAGRAGRGAVGRGVRIDVGGLVERVDSLMNQVAGVPGMPDGQDLDEDYLRFTVSSTPNPEAQSELHSAAAPTMEPTTEKLAPKTCASNEEEFGGLCYMTCRNLTNGTNPYRLSAYQCCQENSLFSCWLSDRAENISAFKFALPGSGFDQDGSGNAPHPPGSCFENEENLLNVCYMKCTLLTMGEYPMRSAPNTCCKAEPCWNIMNTRSSGLGCQGYGIGGGSGNQSCPHEPH